MCFRVRSDLFLSSFFNCFSFDRVQCEILAERITRELVEREKVLKDDKRNIKLEKDKEKKQRRCQKQIKKERDLTGKEKARRLVKLFFSTSIQIWCQWSINCLHSREYVLNFYSRLEVISLLGVAFFPSLNRASSQRENLEDQDGEKDLSVSDEPLPECTVAFTHGIGKEVTEK